MLHLIHDGPYDQRRIDGHSIIIDSTRCILLMVGGGKRLWNTSDSMRDRYPITYSDRIMIFRLFNEAIITRFINKIHPVMTNYIKSIKNKPLWNDHSEGAHSGP